MSKFYDGLTDTVRAFIAAQPVFFVATAPREGRLNISPKGMDTFRCLDDRTVAFLNLSGSGNETAAHLLDDGRITVMMTSFGDKAMTLRMYGRGRSIHERDPEWAELLPKFPVFEGARQIIVIELDSLMTSCGGGTPEMTFVRRRTIPEDYAVRLGRETVKGYWATHSAKSIDGLPTGILEDCDRES